MAQSPAGRQKISDAEGVALDGDLHRQLGKLEHRSLGPEEMIALGQRLADLLFPPRIRSYLTRSLERIDQDEGLRIRLLIDNNALADVPWEYSYIARPDTPVDQRGPEGFLVLDRRMSLVRSEMLGESPPRLDPIAGPVRLVAVLADPQSPDYPTLDLDKERRSIESALAESKEFSTTFFPHASLTTLEDALASDCQVFHFAGHGEFQADMGKTPRTIEGKGYLILVGKDGGPEPFPADKLAANLRGRGVRLAVLGACEGGRRDAVNAWSGIAPALNRAGIAAVVGMQSYHRRSERHCVRTAALCGPGSRRADRCGRVGWAAGDPEPRPGGRTGLGHAGAIPAR